MASTSLATPPSSPRKASFSSLKLSPIKNLNFIKRKSSVEVTDLALGVENAKRGTTGSTQEVGARPEGAEAKEIGEKEKIGSLRGKKKSDEGAEGANS